MSTTATAPKKADKVSTTPLRKFRLLRGSCRIGKGENARDYKVTINPVTKQRITPVIETDKDLGKLFNCPGFAPKFAEEGKEVEPVVLDPTVRQPGETLQAFLTRLQDLQDSVKSTIDVAIKQVDGYSKEELEDFAEENEVDLKGAKTVEQMRTILKNALKG